MFKKFGPVYAGKSHILIKDMTPKLTLPYA